jgi:hypothetical protein
VILDRLNTKPLKEKIVLETLLSVASGAPWTNFSLQDEPWAEFSTLEVAAACIPCTYCPV